MKNEDLQIKEWLNRFTIEVDEIAMLKDPDILALHKKRVEKEGEGDATGIKSIRGTVAQEIVKSWLNGRDNDEKYGDISADVPDELFGNRKALRLFGNMEIKIHNIPYSYEKTIQTCYSKEYFLANAGTDDEKYSYFKPKSVAAFRISKARSLLALCHQRNQKTQIDTYKPLLWVPIDVSGEMIENEMIIMVNNLKDKW
jgi:hypothetical protein